MKATPKQIFCFVFFCSVLILFAVLRREMLLQKVGDFLVVRNEPKAADAIVVLGGHKERVQYAVELYKRGLAKSVVMSGPQAGDMKKAAVKSGIPDDKVLLESKTVHTYQHPGLLKPIFAEHGFSSVIIVSSPYHMRRAAMLFNREFHDTGVKLLYCPVLKSWFTQNRWWKNTDSRRVVFWEYSKLATNFFGVKFNDLICSVLKKQNDPIMIDY